MKNTSYGFSTVLTENWLDLCNVLIDSILKFSKYNITINCINFYHNFDNPRISSKQININNLDWNTVCMSKWKSLNELPYDITLMIDCDMIALPDVDLVFEENVEKLSNSKFPLFCKHPHNPFTNLNHKDHLQRLINKFSDNQPKMKYVYAHGLFSKQHDFFIKEFISNIDYYLSTGMPYCGDEGLLNALLVKYQVSQDIGYNYMPNTDLINTYLKIDNDTKLYETYINHGCPVKFYLLHGCKDYSISRNILNKII